MFKRTLLLGVLAALALHSSPAQALQWDDNSFHLVYGGAFREPGDAQNIPKMILSFTHVDGYKYGGNFLNVDLLYSINGYGDDVRGDAPVPSGAAEVYITYRHTLSLNKITGTKTFEVGGILRDVGIELGTDLNTKNNGFSSKKIMPVAGVSGSFNVPGFLNVGLLVNKEWGIAAEPITGGEGREISYDATLMLSAAWGIPVYGPVTFEGFGVLNLPKGKDAFGNDTKTELLLHPKVLVDVATFWGSKGVQLGGGFEYWLNKFGNDHNNPFLAGGAEAATFFAEAAIHL